MGPQNEAKTSRVNHSMVSNSLQLIGLKLARLPCPSPTSKAYSNSCPLSRWCHPTISSSVVPFSSCLQSCPASMSQFFASGGQSIGSSPSASALLMNIQGWFPLGWTSWISLLSKGLSTVFSSTTVQNINSLVLMYILVYLYIIQSLCWDFLMFIYINI